MGVYVACFINYNAGIAFGVYHFCLFTIGYVGVLGIGSFNGFVIFLFAFFIIYFFGLVDCLG